VKRPVRHDAPEPGDLYEWDGGSGDQMFVILSVDRSHWEIWLCRALDLQKGCEAKVGIRKRDPYNGWHKVELEPPF
jgi:hypothetical protein